MYEVQEIGRIGEFVETVVTTNVVMQLKTKPQEEISV